MAEITGVLLAAGASRRFGKNKLLAELDGKPLIAHSAATLAPCDRIVAVVPADDEALRAVLAELDVECMINPEPERGMGYSIACGVKASDRSNGWCILPADMPFIKADVTRKLVDALLWGAAIVAPVYNSQRGHPVAFSAHFFDELAALDGDTGARQILQQHADAIKFVQTNDAGILRDIDSPDDLVAAP